MWFQVGEEGVGIDADDTDMPLSSDYDGLDLEDGTIADAKPIGA